MFFFNSLIPCQVKFHSQFKPKNITSTVLREEGFEATGIAHSINLSTASGNFTYYQV
jgi:hypothetical protein